MLTPNRALPLPLAKRQFVLGDARDVLSVDLSLVASLAEVGVSPAKPLCYFTAETTLEGYVLRAMTLAVRGLHRTTTRTY